MKTLTYSLIITSLVLLVGIGYKIINTQTLGGGAGQVATSCTISTVTAVTVGNQVSSTLLAAHSNRAWARIQSPQSATNTVFMSFNAGAAATLNNGLTIGQLNATTTTNLIDFGKNTDFPYTGAVTGITNLGSTTVLVTECRY